MKTTVINKTVVSPDHVKIMIHENDLTRPDPLIVKFVYDEDGDLAYATTLTVNEGASYQLFQVWDDSEDEFIPFTGTITIEV